MTAPTPAERGPSREALACAWELEGALGLPFVVRENGDLAVEPDALDNWWAKVRPRVMESYDHYHPATKGSSHSPLTPVEETP